MCRVNFRICEVSRKQATDGAPEWPVVEWVNVL